jgi:hypothetical protein
MSFGDWTERMSSCALRDTTLGRETTLSNLSGTTSFLPTCISS